MPIFETVTTYNSSGTWVCPAGVYIVFAKVWGPGGPGGQGAAGGGGGGGGGGGYSENWVRVTPGTPYTIQVGGSGQQSFFAGAGVVMAQSGENGGDADGEFPGVGGGGGSPGGESGEMGTFSEGGSGGDGAGGGGAGGMGGNGSPGDPGTQPGGGGGGGGQFESGGSGADGRVIVSYAKMRIFGSTMTYQ